MNILLNNVRFFFLSFFFYLLLFSYAFSGSAYSLETKPFEMIFVPGGSFRMGSRGKLEQGYDGGDGTVGIELGVDEIPQHTVSLEGFYIDKYEVTNAEYKEFIDATGRKAPIDSVAADAPYNWKNGTFPDGEDKHPVTNVNWFDANAYCEWKKKRLPTEEEWEKACRGEETKKWSYGNYFISQYANTYDLQLEWSQATGSFPEDKSPYGIFDMAGNVAEWVGSWYNAYPGSTLKRETFGKQNRVIKGGSFLTDSMAARCSNRNFAIPVKKHRIMGMRCAMDKPGKPEKANNK